LEQQAAVRAAVGAAVPRALLEGAPESKELLAVVAQGASRPGPWRSQVEDPARPRWIWARVLAACQPPPGYLQKETKVAEDLHQLESRVL